MTLWLAIDTSAGTSVALSRNGQVLAESNFEDVMGHAENIGIAIAEVLEQAGVKSSQVEAVAVGRGPAPFTGLRVGIAAAVAFAEGIGVPLYGVVSHDTIAFAQAELLADAATKFLVVRTDARRREEYWSIYSGLDEHGLPIRSQGPGVATAEVIDAYLRELPAPATLAQGNVSAAAIAAIAEVSMHSKALSNDVSALYLRAPDATEPKAHGRVGKSVSG